MTDVSFAVDVSNNQPNHQPWASFGVHMGFAKASEGQHGRDAWFTRHSADIKAAGLLAGSYHFAWPNQSAAAEAANYTAAVRPVAAAGHVHVLDLEPYPEDPGVTPRNYAGVTDDQIRAYATAWVAAVKAAFPGQRVLVYTPRDAVPHHLPGNADGYWYPAYPVQGRSFATAAGLSRPVVGGHSVWGWQFTSVPRDQSVIYLAPADLRAWAAGTTPNVQEDDVATTDADAEKIAQAVATYKNPRLEKDGPDLRQRLVNAEASAKAAADGVKALATKSGTVSLTDDQLAHLAAVVASSPALASAIAEQVAAKIAARLQS